jgi:hypothetical protein
MIISRYCAYQTRGQHRVRLHTIVHRQTNFPVRGDVLIDGKWIPWHWAESGNSPSRPDLLDLVEVNPETGMPLNAENSQR